MNFKNKTVLITGAASGIGRATALAFASLGAKVMVSDVQVEAGKETVQLIEEEKGEALFIEADVADYEAVKSLVKQTVEQFGSLDIAVNNAGIGPKKVARTDQHSVEDWHRVIAVNQTGVFYGMQLQIEQMLKQDGGVIVNIASVAGLKALPNNIAYTASKHAVIGMTKTAALEYARKNIRVNAVCPVFTESAMLDDLLNTKEGLRDQLKRSIPMGRYGKANEIAQAILWLSSDAASFMTGHALPVDGGTMA